MMYEKFAMPVMGVMTVTLVIYLKAVVYVKTLRNHSRE